jgi:hypothetical protein
MNPPVENHVEEPARKPEGEDARIEREIRASGAFEEMVGAAATVAPIAAAAMFAITLGGGLLEGTLGFRGVLAGFATALTFGISVFLIAFAASVAFGAPLFIALEKLRIRRAYPFYLLAFLVQFAALALVRREAPGLDRPIELLYFLPGFFIVWLFTRRLKKLWRATPAPRPPADVVRLH